MEWVNFAFLLANLGFAAFNARTSWKNTRREEQKSLPTVEVSVVLGEGGTLAVDLLYPSGPNVKWLPAEAKLVAPKAGKIVNPMTLLSLNSDNEPWMPPILDVDWSKQGHSTRLLVSERPGREVLWVLLNDALERRLLVDLWFQSAEPQPRRHKIRLSRTITTFAPSKAN